MMLEVMLLCHFIYIRFFVIKFVRIKKKIKKEIFKI